MLGQGGVDAGRKGRGYSAVRTMDRQRPMGQGRAPAAPARGLHAPWEARVGRVTLYGALPVQRRRDAGAAGRAPRRACS
jgi:hypothetical protein